MPADVPVSLTPWFDAKDNPPEKREARPTDVGILTYKTTWVHDEKHPGRGYYATTWCEIDSRGISRVADPQPTVYCDPSPPDMNDPLGPLTADDLRTAIEALVDTMPAVLPGVGPGRRATIARLRRALEALGTDEACPE